MEHGHSRWQHEHEDLVPGSDAPQVPEMGAQWQWQCTHLRQWQCTVAVAEAHIEGEDL